MHYIFKYTYLNILLKIYCFKCCYKTEIFTFDKYSFKMKEVKKPHEISDLDRETIMRIAAKAKALRIKMGYSYEEFALNHAKINRNTYFKFEKSALSGDNFTINTLARVLRGLNQTFQSFFQDL